MPECHPFRRRVGKLIRNNMRDIDKNTLEEWVEANATESETLEFKAILPPRDGKQEFLKDVSAMSNANGGTIVYGITEKAGQAAFINAIKTESSDGAIRRLEQCMEGGIEPRLTGIKFKEVLVEGGYVLTVTVPRSFAGPHRVIFNSKNTFFLRSHRHVAEYSYTQLREAFTLRAHAEDKIRAWRAERLLMIKAGRTPIPLWKEARYVLHIFPIASFSGNFKVDPGEVDRDNCYLLLEPRQSFRRYYNLDGLVLAYGIDERQNARYVQLFRDGALETAGFVGRFLDNQEIIPAVRLIELRAALSKQLQALMNIGIVGPVGVSLSLLSVQNYKILSEEYELATDRDDLELPEVWMESIEDLNGNVDILLRPIFDTLWQCFNELRCPLYDGSGKWNPQ